MSLVWSIDPEKRLMTAVAAGDVTRADVAAFFEETTAAGVAPYFKLFDGSAIETPLDPEDMLALGVQMRSLHRPGGEMGPLAIVLPLHVMELAHRMVGILAVADRPMRVFTDVEPARAWLEEMGCPLHRPKKKPGPPRKR
jgi:hypothetical protein